VYAIAAAWLISRCPAQPEPPLPVDIASVAGAAIYITLLMNALLKLFTSLGSPEAHYILIEAAQSLVTGGCYFIRSVHCDVMLPPGADEQFSVVGLVNWVCCNLTLTTLLGLVAMGPRRSVLGAVVGGSFNNVAGAVMLLLPRGRARAIVSAACGLGAFTCMCSVLHLTARVARTMRTGKHSAKVWAVTFAAIVFGASCTAWIATWLLQWYFERPRPHALRMAALCVDAGGIALLSRVLLIVNSAKMEQRQLEVMRAVESSSTYKVWLSLRMFQQNYAAPRQDYAAPRRAMC
jgi:hypothetical protein